MEYQPLFDEVDDVLENALNKTDKFKNAWINFNKMRLYNTKRDHETMYNEFVEWLVERFGNWETGVKEFMFDFKNFIKTNEELQAEREECEKRWEDLKICKEPVIDYKPSFSTLEEMETLQQENPLCKELRQANFNLISLLIPNEAADTGHNTYSNGKIHFTSYNTCIKENGREGFCPIRWHIEPKYYFMNKEELLADFAKYGEAMLKTKE